MLTLMQGFGIAVSMQQGDGAQCLLALAQRICQPANLALIVTVLLLEKDDALALFLDDNRCICRQLWRWWIVCEQDHPAFCPKLAAHSALDQLQVKPSSMASVSSP